MHICNEGYSSCHDCVRVCVCTLSHISPLEHLFVLKKMSRTQQATDVEIFVGFSLKLLCSRATALPALYSYCAVGHFYMCALLKYHFDHGLGFGQ